MNKPLLFLDVDGVVNAFAAVVGRHPDLYRREVVYRRNRGWGTSQVVLNRTHPPMLATLAEAFELVWATAWEHRANGSLRQLLGLPGKLPVVTFPDREDGSVLHWKTRRLLQYAAGRPFCWIDDEATAADRRFFTDNGATALVLTPDPEEGMTENDLYAAQHFADTTDADKIGLVRAANGVHNMPSPPQDEPWRCACGAIVAQPQASDKAALGAFLNHALANRAD